MTDIVQPRFSSEIQSYLIICACVVVFLRRAKLHLYRIIKTAFVTGHVNIKRLAFLLEFDQSPPRQRSSDLQPFRHDGRRDQLVLRDLLVQLVVRSFIEQHLIVQLVPNLSLGPLLLLGLTTPRTLLFLLSLLGLLGRTLYIFLGRLRKLLITTRAVMAT